jgi:hypothetical protein
VKNYTVKNDKRGQSGKKTQQAFNIDLSIAVGQKIRDLRGKKLHEAALAVNFSLDAKS